MVKVYAGCPDISLRVTRDIKHAGRSSLVFVDHPVAEMLPEDLRVMQALDRVVRLLCVGSKRFLWFLWLVTSKVERWMRGLMAQQQCCTCR